MGNTELIIIAAMTRQWVIGDRGRLPWHLPEELQLFRQLTLGHCVVMGRGTFETIGRPLPGRHNIVLSSALAPRPDLRVCRSFPEALSAAGASGQKVFFIGGAEIYRLALPIAGTLHVSWVRASRTGDTVFPWFDGRSWRVVNAKDYGAFRHVEYRHRG
jgi:dihydrofolate reductase